MTGFGLEILEWAAKLLELAGAFLFLSSAIGLVRLPDFYTRVHSPTKAATLGITFLVASSALESIVRGDVIWLEDVVIIVFLWITVPVSSQVLLRLARDQDVSEEKRDTAHSKLP